MKHQPQGWFIAGGERAFRGRRENPLVPTAQSPGRREDRVLLAQSQEGEDLAAESECVLAQGAAWQKVQRWK